MAGFDNFPAQGVPFHGEFSAADASTGTLATEALHRYSLFIAGTTAATTINAGDTVIITDMQFASAVSTNLVSIYDGGDNDIGAGESIGTKLRATNFWSQGFVTPHWCQTGSYPKLKQEVGGQVDSVIRGVIKRAV